MFNYLNQKLADLDLQCFLIRINPGSAGQANNELFTEERKLKAPYSFESSLAILQIDKKHAKIKAIFRNKGFLNIALIFEWFMSLCLFGEKIYNNITVINNNLPNSAF